MRRERERRKLAVEVLTLLNEGVKTQNEIARLVFNGNQVKCSRVLEKLEAWNYITRETKQRKKIVKIRGVE